MADEEEEGKEARKQENEDTVDEKEEDKNSNSSKNRSNKIDDDCLPGGVMGLYRGVNSKSHDVTPSVLVVTQGVVHLAQGPVPVVKHIQSALCRHQ